MPIAPELRHHWFCQAADLLGGSRSAARALGIKERSMRDLLAGHMTLHDGFLKDMQHALLMHATHFSQHASALGEMLGGARG